MKIKEWVRNLWRRVRRIEVPIIEEIPDFNDAEHYEREEYFYMGYMISFFVFFIVWLQASDPLIDLLLAYFPSIGPVPATWIVNALLGLLLLSVGLLVRQAKINYVQKLHEKANAYPWMTGTITEMTEEGYQTKKYQLPIRDVRRLATGGDEVDLWGNPGTMTVAPGDNIYLVNTAYQPEDSLLEELLVITRGTLEDHLALKRFEDVFVGWVSVNKQVAKVNFVVPTRVQEQRPILYVGYSAVTVSEILRNQTPKLVDEEEIYAAERLKALTMGERLQAKSVQDQARIGKLEDENLRLKRALIHSENEWEEEQSVILTPEKEHVPIINLTGWKMYAFYGILAFLVVALIWGVGHYFMVW